MSGDWARLRAVVEAALDAGPERREEAMRAAAAGDEGALRAARSLLAQGEDPEFLTPPVRGAAGMVAARAAAARGVGRRFGPYRAVGVIAVGGMGAVYRAVRDDAAFERVVAVKTIPALLEDAGAVERFTQERRLLARLSHPGIAALLDGGCSEEGVPYLVLEYVDGEPLVEYCRGHGLGARECAGLMRRVCEGVRHAHQNLIVHRDLKPDNILVTAEGEPKLLDFGISRLVDEVSPQRGATVVRALSPGYASPEQLLGEPVTTASDVFSLGVVLYEALTGRAPWMGDGSAGEVLTRLPPAAPSGVAGCAAGVARDLDLIVLKALAIEAGARYQSAEAMGEDLRRWLAGEPVRARAPTALYRVRRLIGRNRAATAGVVVAVLGLVGMVGALAWRAADLVRERDRTSGALTTAADLNAFLGGTLEAADAGTAEGRELTVKAMLDEAAGRVEGQLGARPASAGAVHLTLARAYAGLGRLREAYDQAARAVEALRRAGDESRGVLAEALEMRSGAASGVSDPLGVDGGAERDLEEAMEIRRAEFGAGAGPTLRTMRLLGSRRAMRGDAEGGRLIESAMEGYRGLGPEGREGVIACLQDLADGATARGEHAESAARRLQAIGLIRESGESDGLTTALARLGETYCAAGEWGAAESVTREALAMAERLHGAEHPTVTFQMLTLATALEGLGRFDQAEAQYRGALSVALARLPADHYIPLVLRHRFGQFLERRGRHAEAQEQLSAAYDGVVATLGTGHISARAVARAMAASVEAGGDAAGAAVWRARAGE